VRGVIAALALVSAPFAGSPASAEVSIAVVSCRDYPRALLPAVKLRVEAVRLLEREAADRLRGLDTRTYPFLAGEVRKAADAIADAKAAEDEAAAVAKCRNMVHPLRSICRGAVLALASAIDEQEQKDAVSKEARQAYGQGMAVCERLVGLAPLGTAWRTAD
jgi:hypothetical protein